MPKFTIEIDTDAKTCKKSVNGVEMDFDEFSLSQYSYYDCDENNVTEYHVGIGMRNEGERYYHSYNWSEKESEMSELEYSTIKASEEEVKNKPKRYYLFEEYKKEEGKKDYDKKKDK